MAVAPVPMQRQSGFTLLEAIVALVIFTMGALALYSWLDVNLRTLARVQERQETVALVNSALDMVRRINPMQTPRGRRAIGDTVFEWEAKPLQPPRNGLTQIGQPTLFQVALFAVDVRVSRGKVEIEKFTVRQVGYKQVHALEEE